VGSVIRPADVMAIHDAETWPGTTALSSHIAVDGFLLVALLAFWGPFFASLLAGS